MKNHYLILLSSFTLLTACKEEDNPPLPPDTDFAAAFEGTYMGDFHDTYHYSGTSINNYQDAYSSDTTYNSSMSLTRLNDTSLVLHKGVDFEYTPYMIDTIYLASDTSVYEYFLSSGGLYWWQLTLTKDTIPANNSVYLRYVYDPAPSGHSITVQEFTSYQRIN